MVEILDPFYRDPGSTEKGAALTMVAECSENMYKIMKYFMPTKVRWCDDRASLIGRCELSR